LIDKKTFDLKTEFLNFSHQRYGSYKDLHLSSKKTPRKKSSHRKKIKPSLLVCFKK